MSQTFTAIAVRQNTQITDAGWWNILRLAGISIENFLGLGYLAQTPVAIANNQSSAANVTGLLFSSASVRSAIIEYQIRRVSTSTGAVERVSSGRGTATYNTLATAWTYTPLGEGGDASGVTLDITSGGQVQYTSDNMAGTYDAVNSLITFTARTF